MDNLTDFVPTEIDGSRTRAMQVFDLILRIRNARVGDIRCAEEFEAWSRQRRKVAAFVATLPRPDLMPSTRPVISWYAWSGRRWAQYFASTPERAAEGPAVLSVQTRGPLFSYSLWDAYCEAERAMAPVCYAVIACGLAFLGFAAWWMR